MVRIFLSFIVLMTAATGLSAQTASEVPLTNPEVLAPPSREQGVSPSPNPSAQKMTLEKMVAIVKRLDENVAVRGNAILLTIADVQVTVVADPKANRMRAFSPFQTLDGVDGKTLYRMMQANFDSALDARYAIAKGYLMSVFIHPFSELTDDQFIEGIGQVVNLVKTFGTAFTSGAITFGGGDSGKLHRKLIDDLLDKGKRI
jgi:hypothetical protein